MSKHVFTKGELYMFGKMAKYALVLLLMTAVITSLIRVVLVYSVDGQAGLKKLIQRDAKPAAAVPDQSLKDSLEAKKDSVPKTTTIEPGMVEAPLSLQIPSLGVNTKIESPESTNVSVLDSALKRAAVYYPGSGTPGNGNMLVFGHSTGFKIVNNQAYKVFNNLKSAKTGAEIYVRTASGVHTYKVRSVKHVSKYDTWINFRSDSAMLTLSTCDSFGKSSDRWVIEADYMGFANS